MLSAKWGRNRALDPGLTWISQPKSLPTEPSWLVAMLNIYCMHISCSWYGHLDCMGNVSCKSYMTILLAFFSDLDWPVHVINENDDCKLLEWYTLLGCVVDMYIIYLRCCAIPGPLFRPTSVPELSLRLEERPIYTGHVWCMPEQCMYISISSRGEKNLAMYAHYNVNSSVLFNNSVRYTQLWWWKKKNDQLELVFDFCCYAWAVKVWGEF